MDNSKSIIENKGNVRNISLDFLRVIAVLAVIMIHVSASFVVDFNNTTLEFVVGNIFDAISRVGVPIFVMISGALMLKEDKEITLKKLFKKNILNIVWLLLFWSFCYACVFHIIVPLIKNQNINFKNFGLEFVFGYYHLWYLFMILGLYLITPILRLITKKENSKLILYFILLSLVFQFTTPLLEYFSKTVSGLNLLIQVLSSFQMEFVFGYVSYYLAGWYVVNVGIGEKYKKIIHIVGLVCLLLVVCLAQLFTKSYNYMYSNLNILIFFYSVAIFDLILTYFSAKANHVAVIKLLSSLSFGVYAIHVFILYLMINLFNFISNPLVFVLVVWIVTSLLSFASVYVISKIPVVKKIVRG